MKTLLVAREGGVVTATLNRPARRNALSLTMFRELRELIDEVARTPADRVLAVAAIKKSLDRAHELSFAEALEVETLAQAALTGTLDFAEAMAAFRDKREPKFRGA